MTCQETQNYNSKTDSGAGAFACYDPSLSKNSKTLKSDENNETENKENLTSRDEYKNYWDHAYKEFGSTLSGMLLLPKLDDKINQDDRIEIINCLSTHIKDSLPVDTLIELGAGIGRLTPYLMKMCRKIVAMDFIPEYIKSNEQQNFSKERPDDQFICADATSFEWPAESVDVLFWNWLIMYLNDTELMKFLNQSFRWVKKGGYIFCRESCDAPSNTEPRKWAKDGNPSTYRSTKQYTELFKQTAKAIPDCQLEFILTETPINAYKKHLGRTTQFAWLMRRI